MEGDFMASGRMLYAPRTSRLELTREAMEPAVAGDGFQ